MQYTVLTDSKSPGISGGLTYESDQAIAPGSLVAVPLRNKATSGIVLDAKQKHTDQTFDVKSVSTVLGEHPLLQTYHLQTMQWMSEYYCCSLRAAARPFLPGGKWADLLPKAEIGYRLNDDANVELITGKKQLAVIEALRGQEWLPAAVLKDVSGASGATIKSLVEKGIAEESFRVPELQSSNDDTGALNRPSLTVDQQTAYESIKNEPGPSLLFGVTGSGKTEIYAQLIADAVEAGNTAILLVPEILLTEHTIDRFTALLNPDRIGVMHSRLTEAGRRSIWRQAQQGQLDLVIGSRSALFAPLPNLGLVILDEEHEWTYKNEQTPRYHARNVAQKLCEYAGAKLLLGSATPSLESWQAAISRGHLARLPHRYKNAAMPDVTVVDLAEVNFGNLYPFSPTLLEAIDNRLKRGEQSVLFLNRRGMASALLCLDCRRRLVSPDSQLPFTVHRGPGGTARLIDHTTGLTLPIPAGCPHCGSAKLYEVGAGTQLIEDIVAARWPKARVLRADKDTLTSPEQMRDLLQQMRSGEADILLGTQSVVKGLDLPEVTLAAVLIADIGLSLPHFRAGERIFQLLTQLTGRSGRAKPGEVIIQTFRPDAPEVKLAAEHRTEDYITDELKLRKHAGYPPVEPMVRVIFRDSDAAHRAERVAENLRSSGLTKVSHSPTLFGGGKVWHVLARGEGAREAITTSDLQGGVVDIDPLECV